MSEQKSEWQKGDTAKIKIGRHQAGKLLDVLGPAVYVEQWWVPVLDPDEEDPTFFKDAGLEKYITEYIPSTLQEETKGILDQHKEIMYEIGQLDGSKYTRVSLCQGPTSVEQEILEVVGKNEASVIIRFNLDGTEDMIWKWREDRWVRYVQ